MEYPYKDFQLGSKLVKKLINEIEDCQKRHEFLGRCLVVGSYSAMLNQINEGRPYFGNTSITSKALEGREISKTLQEAMSDEGFFKKIKDIPFQDYEKYAGSDRIFSIILLLYTKNKLNYSSVGESVERALTTKTLLDYERTKLDINPIFKEDIDTLRDQAKAKCFLEEENEIRRALILLLKSKQ